MLLEDEQLLEDQVERQIEADQIAVLLDRGLSLTVGKKEYIIKQPFLGTLDNLADEFLKLDVRKDQLNAEDPFVVHEENKRMIKVNAYRCARIAAIAYLNSRWKIKFLVPFYASIFFWNMTPADLMKLTNIIIRMSNLKDFTGSIVLLSVNRTTAPQTIED